MKYLENALSDTECTIFQKYWADNHSKRSFVNWQQEGKVLDRRLRILPEDPEWQIIMQVVNQNFQSTTDVWAAYQRQNFAHNIHIDDYGKEHSLPTYTFVLSLVTEPKFRTIVWKETKADNDALQLEVKKWALMKHRMKKFSNISETEDLEHTVTSDGSYFSDFLNLDGVFVYKKGHGVLFNARQIHCTSNWTKYPEFDGREFLQIHVVSEENLELN